MMDNYTGYGMGSTNTWWIVVFIMFLLMIVVVVGILITIHYLWLPTRKQDQKEAIHLLEKRFAAGEIDKKEFEEKRTILSE